MPKVKKEYFVEKEKKIVDAAIRVCKSKPAYAVTMRDIMRECGISIGGIYCYFSDIDEIFAEIINRTYNDHQIGENINLLFESGKSPAEIITDSFALLGHMTDEIIRQYGNLIYELNAIYLNEPERGQKVQSRIQINNDNDVLFGKIIEFIETHIANQYFQPIVPKEHLMLHISVALQGITRMITFSENCELMQAQFGVTKEYTTAQGMMKILAQIIISLLQSGSDGGFKDEGK